MGSTAAHASFCIRPNGKVEINGVLREIDSLFVHKQYTPGQSHDIALVKLKQPVKDVKPATLQLKGDELGKTIWFIGVGGTGSGLNGETIDNSANKGVLRKSAKPSEFCSRTIIKI